jgi:hypothetical protein
MSVCVYSVCVVLCIFFLVSWDAVRLSIVGTSATNWPTVSAPDDRWWWWMWSSLRNEDWQGKSKYSEKICSSATLSTRNHTWPDLGSNPGRRDGLSCVGSVLATGWSPVQGVLLKRNKNVSQMSYSRKWEQQEIWMMMVYNNIFQKIDNCPDTSVTQWPQHSHKYLPHGTTRSDCGTPFFLLNIKNVTPGKNKLYFSEIMIYFYRQSVPKFIHWHKHNCIYCALQWL